MFIEFNSQAPPLSGLPDSEELQRRAAMGLVSEADRDQNKNCLLWAFRAAEESFGNVKDLQTASEARKGWNRQPE